MATETRLERLAAERIEREERESSENVFTSKSPMVVLLLFAVAVFINAFLKNATRQETKVLSLSLSPVSLSISLSVSRLSLSLSAIHQCKNALRSTPGDVCIGFFCRTRSSSRFAR